MKSAEGEVKVAVLGDSPGAKEYLQHLNAFSRMLARKKLADDLQKCAKAVVTATAAVRKHSKIPNGEKTSEKAQRLSLLEPAEKELVTSEVAEAVGVYTVMVCRWTDHILSLNLKQKDLSRERQFPHWIFTHKIGERRIAIRILE
jgi:hypothetical protein